MGIIFSSLKIRVPFIIFDRCNSQMIIIAKHMYVSVYMSDLYLFQYPSTIIYIPVQLLFFQNWHLQQRAKQTDHVPLYDVK